jgi:hypothetical protein
MSTSAMSTSTVAAGADGSPLVVGGVWLGHFDLQVVDARQAHQGAAGFCGNSIALALGKAWQGQAEQGPIPLQARLLDPAELHQAAATA